MTWVDSKRFIHYIDGFTNGNTVLLLMIGFLLSINTSSLLHRQATTYVIN